MNTTAISTTIVEFVTSFLVGQATFFSSARTSERYWRGPVFSFVGCCCGWARRSGARGLSAPCFAMRRFVCRFTALLSRVEQGRRDSNPQPPVLETGALPIELLPFETGLWNWPPGRFGWSRSGRGPNSQDSSAPLPHFGRTLRAHTSGAHFGRSRTPTAQTGTVRRRARATSTAAVVVPAAA